MSFPYSLVYKEGHKNLTIFLSEDLIVINDDNKNFEEILELLEKDDVTEDEIVKLADYSEAVADRFDALSDRVSVSGGTVYFDNDPVHNSISKHIIRCLEEGDEEDWAPIVYFLERVMTNPNNHSRQQLYNWLDIHDFTITQEGKIIAYKGVRKKNEGEGYSSTSSGFSIVNGVKKDNGYVDQDIGDTVEMPRSMVQHDPKAACSVGLHVGTPSYAANFGDTLLKVLVDPRDVVSVPEDGGWAKVRVCRYRVLEELNSVPTKVDPFGDSYYENEEDYYDVDEGYDYEEDFYDEY